MARRLTTTSDRVTLALHLADGALLPVEGSAGCMRFIGRYSRLLAFGPLGTPLRAHVVSKDD